MDLIYFLLVTIITYVLSSIIFGALNNSTLQLFQSLQGQIAHLKRKKYYYIATKVGMIFILLLLNEVFDLRIVMSGVVFGSLMGLTDTIFGKSIGERSSS